MRPGGGKQKGGSYERKINKILSLWLSNEESSDLLKRSSGSGAKATVAEKKGEILRNEAGDAVAIDDRAFDFIDKYFLEYKNYKEMNILSFLIKNTGELARFWKKAKKQAKKYGKVPIIIFKQNYMPDMMLMRRADLEPKGFLTAMTRGNLIICLLSDFLDIYEFNTDFSFFVVKTRKQGTIK